MKKKFRLILKNILLRRVHLVPWFYIILGSIFVSSFLESLRLAIFIGFFFIFVTTLNQLSTKYDEELKIKRKIKKDN